MTSVKSRSLCSNGPSQYIYISEACAWKLSFISSIFCAGSKGDLPPIGRSLTDNHCPACSSDRVVECLSCNILMILHPSKFLQNYGIIIGTNLSSNNLEEPMVHFL
jgi:hypothetical protein